MIDSATKRYSLIGVLPVPDGTITGAEKYGFFGEYAGNTWPAPSVSGPPAALSLTADTLTTGLVLAADSLVTGLALTTDS